MAPVGGTSAVEGDEVGADRSGDETATREGDPQAKLGAAVLASCVVGAEMPGRAGEDPLDMEYGTGTT